MIFHPCLCRKWIPAVSHCGSGIGWNFLHCSQPVPSFCYSLFFLFITPWMLRNCGKRSTIARLSSVCLQLKIQTAYSIFPTAVMCTVWFLKQDKISQYQKIENAFELQSIYITRYSVRLILSLNRQPVVSNASVTDYIIDGIYTGQASDYKARIGLK